MTRGRKRKPAHLRLVEGWNVTRHGTEEELRAAAAKSAAAKSAFGKLSRPKHFKGFALEAWDRYVAPATWLDATREPAAIVFCELWSEFRSDPQSFQSSKHSQMRAYLSLLMDERSRVVKEEKEDEHFDD
jgi:hypothetical protein